MQPRDWKVKPLQMNKIWYKRRIFRRKYFDYKEDAKNSQFALKSLTVYSFVFFLYKKRLLSKIKSRIVEFPEVNKTIIKQNKVWTHTTDQFKRQNATNDAKPVKETVKKIIWTYLYWILCILLFFYQLTFSLLKLQIYYLILDHQVN